MPNAAGSFVKAKLIVLNLDETLDYLYLVFQHPPPPSIFFFFSLLLRVNNVLKFLYVPYFRCHIIREVRQNTFKRKICNYLQRTTILKTKPTTT